MYFSFELNASMLDLYFSYVEETEEFDMVTRSI